MSSNSAHLILGDHILRAWRTPKPRGGGFREAPDLTIYGHRAHRTNRKWGELPPSQPRQSERGGGGHAQKPGAEPARPYPPSPHTQPLRVRPEHCPRSVAFPRHKEGNRGMHAQTEAGLSFYCLA